MRRSFLITVAAAALTLPLAAPAKPPPTRSGSEPIYFTITLQNQAGSGHEEQIEVHAVTWGTRNAAVGGWAKADGLGVTWDVPDSRGTGGRMNGEYVLTSPRHTTGTTSGAPIGNVRVASGDVNDGAAPGRITGVATDPPDPNARGHSMLGASDKLTVGGSQTESAQATGKRQHMPLRSRMYYDTPQGTGPGTLVIKGSLPGCTVGKRYAGMQFAASAKRYALSDVVISNCAPGVVELRYGKVTVRGWNPEKKEQ